MLDNLFAKLILPLWVSLLEIEFNLIAYDKHPCALQFRKNVNFEGLAETEKWLNLNDFLFKERYLNNQKRKLTKTSLGDTACYRYETLNKIVENDISPFINLRNRIAHGQWSVAFNSLGMAKNQQLTQRAWTLSKKDLMIFKILLENFPLLLRNLMSSKNTFEKNYDPPYWEN